MFETAYPIKVCREWQGNSRRACWICVLPKRPPPCYLSRVEKIVRRFRSFAEAEKADRDFYRRLSGNERLAILMEMTKEATSQPLERVIRITKLSEDRGTIP